MKVGEQTLQQLHIKNQLIEQTSEQKNLGDKLEFKIGQKINAFVAETMENMVKLSIEGKLVNARLSSAQLLKLGEIVNLEVLGKQNGLLQVKLLNSTEDVPQNTLNEQLKSQMLKLDIQFSDKAVVVLKAMHEQGQPITKENFQNLQQNFSALLEMAKTIVKSDGTATIHWQLAPKEAVLQSIQTVQPPKLAQTMLTETPVQSNLENAKVSSDIIAQGKIDKSASVKDDSSFVKEEEKLITNALSNKELFQNTSIKTIKFLDQNLKQAFLQMSSDENRSLQTLSFMQRHNIPLTILNTTLCDQLLSGKMGIMSSLQQMLKTDADTLPPQLKQVLEQLFKALPKWQALPENFSGDELKTLFEASAKLQQVILQTRLTSRTGEKLEHIEIIKQTQTLLNDSPINWQAIQIPLQIQKNIEEVDIYIKGDNKKGGKLNPDDGLIYVALNTQHMSLIRVKIKLAKNDIKIDFITEEKAVKNFLSDYIEMFQVSLSSMTDKKVIIDFNATETNLNLAELDKLDVTGLTAFDMKV